MIHKGYILDGSDAFYFSSSEWEALVIVGIVAACISIFCNILVITLQSLMLCFRRTTTTRLTLRLITVACFCNTMYCALEIAAIAIPSANSACRPIIYLITSFDTMTSMALSMVGLNLVMLFIFKIYRSTKAEIAYYMIVLLSGLLVSLVPLGVGEIVMDRITLKHPYFNRYHFYFEDRVENVFNWMWYYGWLMLSLVFAATCAFLSIRYVVKNQKNLAGVLNMFAQREREEVVNAQGFRRYNPTNTNVFLKIARRCVCYPLVPLFSKIWGVAIAIASAENKDIPFSIFIVDRALTCLFGFMVACIYFSDPAIKNVIKETINSIKQTYVYDYYSIKYQPGSNSDGSIIDEKYLQMLQIIPLDKNNIESVTEFITNIKQYNIEDQQEPSSDNFQRDSHLHHSLEISENHITIPVSEPPRVELEIIQGERVDTSSQDQQNCYRRIMKLTCVDGKIVVPEELITEAPKRRFNIFSVSKSNVSTVPMRRLSRVAAPNFIVDKRTSSIPEETYTFHAEFVDTMVIFKYPKAAKFIHWCMMSVFRVNPDKHKADSKILTDSNQSNKRVFRDFTDSSNPQTPALDTRSRASLDVAECSNKVETKPVIPEEESLHEDVIIKEIPDNNPVKTKAITIDDNLPTSSGSPVKTSSAISVNMDPVVKRPGHYRSRSINIASLNREKLKLDSPSASTKSRTSLTTTQKIASSFGLRKLYDKSLALSTALARSSSSSDESSECIEPEDQQVNDKEVEREDVKMDHQNIESIPITKPIKSLLMMDEFEFPVELSPRPLKQYQNLNSRPNIIENTGASETNRINSIKSTDGHDASSFGIHLEPKTIPKDPIPEQSKSDDSSFKNICTSLNYISNWQLNGSRERIGGTFEHWDLEQQLLEQTRNSKLRNQL
ncbi:hypothetical protein K501DRAFT_301840 [Backusella circina FSU 941]|nr:hypothetical protein K501DRAFT_301840 [Backusella circina FSU 941]